MAVNLDYRLYLGKSSGNTYNAYTTNSTATTEDKDIDLDAGRVFDSEKIKENYNYVEKIIGLNPNDEYDTPESVISKFFADDPEMQEALRYEFTEFDEVTEAEIQRRQNNGMTRAEAIESLDLSMDTSVSSPDIPKEEVVEVTTESAYSTFTEGRVHEAEKMLKTRSTGGLFGANKNSGEGFYTFFTDESFSSADIVQIALEYNKEDESLAKALDYTFGNSTLDPETAKQRQQKCQESYIAALIEQAKAGNEEAIVLLCKELHNATESPDGIAEMFIDEFFKQADNETIKLVYENYKEVNDESFMNEMKEEDLNDYVERINKAF